jgi:CopG family nickel-responsive transcriptional regulator
MAIKRFGVSLENGMLEALDQLVISHHFPNRSQAIRFLIEKHLVEKRWECNNVVAGTIVLVYDHHKRELNNKLIDVQHQHHHLILSVQHVHLDHDNCMENIIVSGKSKELTKLSDKICGLKGITYGKLVMSPGR